MKRHNICIDLGTANTLIWTDISSSVVFNEPTVLTIDRKTKTVLEIGYLAGKMAGKTPYNVDIVFPLHDGVIADLDAVIMFLKQAIKNLHLGKALKNACFYLATPSDVTPVEQHALVDLDVGLGAKKIIIESEARMAAIGSGIDIYSPQGSLIMDIGGGTTDVAIIALGEIVKTKAHHVAGNAFSSAIRKYLRTKYKLLIGDKTAEYIKMKIGSVTEPSNNSLLEVSGRDLLTGLPHSVIISSSDIYNCLIPLADSLVELIIETLEETPPELSTDISTNGLILSGGGSLLKGLREYLKERLHIPVHLTPFPLESVIRGLAEIATMSNNKKD